MGFQALARRRRREYEEGEGEGGDGINDEDGEDDDDDDDKDEPIEAPRAVVGVEGIYDLVLFAARDVDLHAEGHIGWEEEKLKLGFGLTPGLAGDREECGNDVDNLAQRAKNMDMAGPYADILRNAFGQQQQQQQQQRSDNDDDNDSTGINARKVSESGSNIEAEAEAEADDESIQLKYIRQWYRASPTSIIKDVNTNTNANANANANANTTTSNTSNTSTTNMNDDDNTLIVLAHSSADELVGWRQVDAMDRALRAAGCTVVREDEENDSDRSDNDNDDGKEGRNGESMKHQKEKGKKKRKLARIIDIKGGLGHDEIWQDGKALAGIIAQSVRWVL